VRILGIDPSLTSTGLVVVEGGKVTDSARVRTRLTAHERIDHILSAIGWLARDVDLVGIEGTAYAAKGSSVVQVFGLWGVVSHFLWEARHPYYVIPPACRVKYATGKGNNSKDEVLAAVVRRYAEVTVTGNDVADALVVAAMGARHYGEPLESSLPQVNLKAMEKIVWPPFP
jgi:crossover junction endodeoxyribonuclease RuvC